MEGLVRFCGKISYATGYLAGITLLGIIVLTMIEVVSRYVLQNPLILSDEIGGYALVAVTFLGLAHCGQTKGHIRITFLVERLEPLTAGRVRVVTLLLGVVFVTVAAWVSWQFLGDSFARGMRSNSMLMTPLKWPQMVMPIGFTLFALVLLGQFAKAMLNLLAGRAADEFSAEEF